MMHLLVCVCVSVFACLHMLRKEKKKETNKQSTAATPQNKFKDWVFPGVKTETQSNTEETEWVQTPQMTHRYFITLMLLQVPFYIY